jgi:hypothetical protein
VSELDRDDRLRLDYGATTDLLRTLADARFRLLAFVPTIAGAAVALFGKPRPAAELVPVGLLGLAATAGVLLYELRNSQIFDYAVRRAAALEEELRLESPREPSEAGGLFRERPGEPARLFGLVRVGQGRGLALVYGAALSGWGYLTAWGVLRWIGVGHARLVGGVLGLVIGVVVLAELERAETRFDRPS